MLYNRLHNYSLYIFVFLLHFEYWDILPGASGTFSLTKLAGYIYFIFSIVNFKNSFRTEKLQPFLISLWLLYFLLLIQSAYNFVLYPSIDSVLNLSIFQCIILFWIVANHLLRREEIILDVLKVYILGAMVVSILSSFNLGTILTSDGRLLMFGEDPNYVGYRLTFAIIIIIGIILDKSLRKDNYRYLWAAAIPFLISTLTYTGSRGAILCLFLSMLAYSLMVRTQWFIKPIIILLFLIVMYFMFEYFDQNPMFHKRFLMTVEGGDTAHRTEIWQRLIPLFYDNPLFGIGETGYNQSTIEIFGKLRGAHNVYIEVLLKTGILGLLLFFGFIYSELKRGLVFWRNSNNILPLILLFSGLFLFSNIQGLYNKTVYIIFALVIAMSYNYKTVEISSLFE